MSIVDPSRIAETELGSGEIARYARHLSLPGFGLEGQKRLKASRVLCIGAGGLGSPASLYLAAAGVGTLGVIDFDVVDKTNLQRQILFTAQDIGQGKASASQRRLQQLNADITVELFSILQADIRCDL